MIGTNLCLEIYNALLTTVNVAKRQSETRGVLCSLNSLDCIAQSQSYIPQLAYRLLLEQSHYITLYCLDVKVTHIFFFIRFKVG